MAKTGRNEKFRQNVDNVENVDKSNADILPKEKVSADTGGKLPETVKNGL